VNRSAFGEVTDKSLVSWFFWFTVYHIVHRKFILSYAYITFMLVHTAESRLVFCCSKQLHTVVV